MIQKGVTPPICGVLIHIPHMGLHGPRGFTRDFQCRCYLQTIRGVFRVVQAHLAYYSHIRVAKEGGEGPISKGTGPLLVFCKSLILVATNNVLNADLRRIGRATKTQKRRIVISSIMSSINILESLGTISPIKIGREWMDAHV